jgi:hypothetical protein
MTIVKHQIPSTSALDRRWIESAYFQDAYLAPLSQPQASPIDIFVAIFAHHPMWMKSILIARNRIASLCGLDAPTAQEILHPSFKSSYAVGDTIGVWPIFAMTATELLVGRDNKHLDFRLSVFKLMDGKEMNNVSVVVSTVCKTHNVFGKIYLFFVVPFHKWGVQWLISQAITSKRIQCITNI